jgi:hypothetical protein
VGRRRAASASQTSASRRVSDRLWPNPTPTGVHTQRLGDRHSRPGAERRSNFLSGDKSHSNADDPQRKRNPGALCRGDHLRGPVAVRRLSRTAEFMNRDAREYRESYNCDSNDEAAERRHKRSAARRTSATVDLPRSARNARANNAALRFCLYPLYGWGLSRVLLARVPGNSGGDENGRPKMPGVSSRKGTEYRRRTVPRMAVLRYWTHSRVSALSPRLSPIEIAIARPPRSVH